MRSASHALAGLLAVLTLVVVGPAPVRAAAGTAAPVCPATVADQPLSVAAPFSGTPRPQADADGTIVATSLLCAYGEGVEPAATVTVTWTAAGAGAACHDVDVAVAPALDIAPFARAASALGRGLGPVCPAPSPGMVRPVLVAGAVGAVATALLLARRRRRRPARDLPAGARARPEPQPEPAGVVTPVAPSGTTPDLSPVLATFAGVGGRAFARTGAGQMATLAALAYAAGDTVVGDLARAGSLQGRGGHRPPRAEITALARAVAHQAPAVDR